MKKTVLTISLIVMLFAVSVLCFSACSSPVDSDPPEIADVYATDVNVVYDGFPHTITVNNTQASDVVLYSTDNVHWSEVPPTFTVPDVYKVYYHVMRAGFKDLYAYATITISRSVLNNVSAPNKTVVYDGSPHCIDIIGTSSADDISYSLDGINFTQTVECTEIGQYTIYYRVNGLYGDYADSSTLFILPNISGKYLNKNYGIIILTENTCIFDNDELPIFYGVDGNGKINSETDFYVKNDIFCVNDVNFDKIPSNSNIFCINGNYCYAYSDTISLDIYFINNCAEIQLTNEILCVISNVNYCPDGIYFNYDMSHCTFAVNSSATVTRLDIPFELLSEQSIALPSLLYIYDGLPHGYEFDYDGEVVFPTESTPQYIEIGVYTDDIILVKDGYLPLKLTGKLEIVADVYGTYYNSDTVIVLAPDNSEIDGNPVDLNYGNGHWNIDGKMIELTADGIKYDGIAYFKAQNILLRFDIGNEIIVAEYSAEDPIIIDIESESSGYAITILEYAENTLFVDSASVKLTVNGTPWFIIDNDDGSYTCIIANSDIIKFNADIIYIVLL